MAKENVTPTASEIQDGKIIETVKSNQEPAIDSTNINVNRGKYDSITLYEITDYELKTLKKGSPTSIYLNFSIFLISIAISFLISLITGNYETISGKFVVFTIICTVGFIVGIILLILWIRNRGDMNNLCEEIEKRLPK
jgi:hypothetical protein